MENKEIIKLKSGESTLAKFFTWLRDDVLRVINKNWVVTLPANAGSATVKDSREKVTIDLSNVLFSTDSQVVNVISDDSYITVTPEVIDGVMTFKIKLTDTTTCP